MIRTGFKTNNVDHCTRLCHASSVAALLQSVGSAAVSAPFTAVKDSECIILIGARPEQNHPVAASYFKQAVKNGTKLIILDPRKQSLSRYATHHLQFNPGQDLALLNAMIFTIIKENLTNKEYIKNHTEGYKQLEKKIKQIDEMNISAAKERAEVELLKLHPDFDEIRDSDDFHEWAEQQPKWIQDALYENENDARAAGRAIDLYKADRNIGKKDTSKDDKSAAKAINTKSKKTDQATFCMIYQVLHDNC